MRFGVFRRLRLPGVLMLAVVLALAGSAAAQAPPPQAPGVGPVLLGPDGPVGSREPTTAEIEGTAPTGPNPMLAFLPAGAKPDYGYWRKLMDQRAARGALTRQAAPDGTGLTLQEAEPAEKAGDNDTPETAEPVPGFGTGAGEARDVTINGHAAELPAETLTVGPFSEDDGSIPLATTVPWTETQTVRVQGRIGDGPHGSAGSGSGDFDVFKLEDVKAGQRVVIRDLLPESSAARMVTGLLFVKAEAENGYDGGFWIGGGENSQVAPIDGDYYVFVGGEIEGRVFDSIPKDPFNSGSGNGVGAEFDYQIGLEVGLGEDVDTYAVDLEAGDVVSAALSGALGFVRMLDPDGRPVAGSTQDASSAYPQDSPLLGGGKGVMDHVAAVSGTHYLIADRKDLRFGDYELRTRVTRPGPERLRPAQRQVLFLDFDGAELNTNIFGGPGVRRLSPLSAFLPGWGLAPTDENAVIDRIVAEVKENLASAHGSDTVQVRNSRDHVDCWGQQRCSRVIVGGTITEAGMETIGVAQSIDVGNFDLSESALVLLDLLSAPADDPNSLNGLAGSGTDKVELVGVGVGNVVAHEAGHFLGNWHTANSVFFDPWERVDVNSEPFPDVANIQDEGGHLPDLAGTGPDNVFGTADDVDVDFGQDHFSLAEPFSGYEDTASRTAYALLAPPGTPGR